LAVEVMQWRFFSWFWDGALMIVWFGNGSFGYVSLACFPSLLGQDSSIISIKLIFNMLMAVNSMDVAK